MSRRSPREDNPLTSVNEVLRFLHPSTPLQIRHATIELLFNFSESTPDRDKMYENLRLLDKVLQSTYEADEVISKCALNTIINVSFGSALQKLLRVKSDQYGNAIKCLVSHIVNEQKSNADMACMALANITRSTENAAQIIASIGPLLNDLITAYVTVGYNKKGSTLNYLSRVFSNLACLEEMRKVLSEANPQPLLQKLISFYKYEQSNIRRDGAITLLKNFSLDPEYHDFLINPENDILSCLLYPLMGDEHYADDEMDKLPMSVQYLPDDKERDFDPDIRLNIFQTLLQICRKRTGRVYLRDNGVYYVLREYHKWEKDLRITETCEQVVNLLIQTEEEIGVEDFAEVFVPEEVVESFGRITMGRINDD